ncbi:hypothetical protein AB5J56_02600 [Streptomyces sp. R21]|uniref:Uncharacterized protein n=1 Tax=Streptomyces sp. R21 TaxID=3238627 RepID=A0AB39P000_9ACTN
MRPCFLLRLPEPSPGHLAALDHILADGDRLAPDDEHFRSRIPPPAQPAPGEKTSGRTEANLRRLRQENTDLRRTLELYEEATRQVALENGALRQGAAVLPLPVRA